MKNTDPKNLAASIKDRLLNQARGTDRPLNELLQYYAIERFLYRLSKSRYRDQFILKGALMFVAWRVPVYRPTKDIDFLGFTSNSLENLVRIVQEVCSQEVKEDGIQFDPGSIQGERIKEDADYQGIRIKLSGTLGNVRLRLQLDVGFADVVSPAPVEIDYPSLLSMPVPSLRGYTAESVVSEKLQAMVALGKANSRMKDFYDLWFLCGNFDFDGPTLQEAMLRTFARRDTKVSSEIPYAFSEAFIQEKKVQWDAFYARLRTEVRPTGFDTVIKELRDFLIPVLQAAYAKDPFPQKWKAGGPWQAINDDEADLRS